LASPALAQQDNPDTIVADCSGQIPQEKVDSCLERARVADETDPSPQMQSLEAQLEIRAHHPDVAPSNSLPGNPAIDNRGQAAASQDMRPYEQPPSDQNDPSNTMAPDNTAPEPPPDNARSQDNPNTQGPQQ
jgi:hypothetical protein